MAMIPTECPKCGRWGQVPSNRLYVKLNCKKCQAPFYLNSDGLTVTGEPPADKSAQSRDEPKKKDKRTPAFVARYGVACVEADALPPDVLAQVVEDHVMATVRDPNAWARGVRAEPNCRGISLNLRTPGGRSTPVPQFYRGGETRSWPFDATSAPTVRTWRGGAGAGDGVNTSLTPNGTGWALRPYAALMVLAVYVEFVTSAVADRAARRSRRLSNACSGAYSARVRGLRVLDASCS